MWKKILIGVVILLIVGSIAAYFYLQALGQAMGRVASDEPFFMTKEPMLAKQLALPIGTRILYDSSQTRQTHEQEKPLQEKAISFLSFPNDKPILWGEMPIELIADYGSHLSVRPVWGADIKPTHRFFALWRECNEDLSFNIKDNTNWQFNPKNLSLAHYACGFNENFKAGSPKMKEMAAELQKMAEK